MFIPGEEVVAALGDGVGEARVRGLGGAPDGRLPDEDEEDEHAAEHVHDAQHAEHHLNGRTPLNSPLLFLSLPEQTRSSAD